MMGIRIELRVMVVELVGCLVIRGMGHVGTFGCVVVSDGTLVGDFWWCSAAGCDFTVAVIG